jgi:putative membrane protein
MGIFSKDDLASIEAAVTAAESECAGELVVTILPRSGRWKFERGAVAGSLTFLATVMAFAFLGEVPLQAVLMGQIITFWLLWYLCGQSSILRPLLNRAQMQAKVMQRAQQLFTAHGIYHTSHRTGLLILISELEHQVAVIEDVAIDKAMGQKGWQAAVDTLTRGLTTGQPLPALLGVIAELAQTMKTVLPAREPSAEGLPNRPIVSDRPAD